MVNDDMMQDADVYIEDGIIKYVLDEEVLSLGVPEVTMVMGQKVFIDDVPDVTMVLVQKFFLKMISQSQPW